MPNQSSERNQISGKVADIKTDEATTSVTIHAGDQRLVSAITNQVAKELALKVNDSVIALLKSTEAELRQKEKLALVGQLVAALAHDLRNPLGVIRGSAQLILDEQQPEDVKHKVSRHIIDEVDQLTDRINHFLRYARQKPPERKPVSPEELVNSALLQWKAHGGPEHITVITHFGQRLPDLCVDPDQINDVLVNLLSNARDAMPAGGRLTVAVSSEADGRIAVEVSDTGSGIAPTALSHIFEPFFTTKAYGTGLGLANVKQLIEDNEGSIEVQSEPGQGSRFTLRFSSVHSTSRPP